MGFNRYVFFLSLLVFSGCDLIDYHPYDTNLDSDTETNINEKNIEKIYSICEGKDTIRFAFMGDTQRAYDETERFMKHLNKRNDIDFVIHGGDLADFGMKKEFEWLHGILSKLTAPYVALIGNHDIIGNGSRVYRKMYGDDNFSFLAGKIKFVCLNTNAIEYDYSKPVPDFVFIRNELIDSVNHYEKTIVVMHAPPFNEQFNNNVAEVFHEYIKRFPSLQFCLHAHTHSVSVNNFFNDGVWYYGCANMEKRGYLLFTMYPDHYDYEVIFF